MKSIGPPQLQDGPNLQFYFYILMLLTQYSCLSVRKIFFVPWKQLDILRVVLYVGNETNHNFSILYLYRIRK